MFQSLGSRLQDALDGLRGRGRLSESDVKKAMREIRVALLEADVNLEVAKDFTQRVQEKAVGSDTLLSLDAYHRVVNIVNEELTATLGGEEAQPTLKNDGNIWMLMGLQGAGKTTTAGKLAHRYKLQGRKPLLVAADTQRPAARDQLRVLGEQIGVPVFEVRDNETAAEIKRRLEGYMTINYHDLVIVDTAGRLQIDEALMGELAELRQTLQPNECMLVIDAMTGQQTLPVAKTFDEKVGGLTGLVMTKMDGDARGGAALSAKHVTGKPIYFAGMSEKIDGLEPFYPDRIASRILGMGDVLTLIEKAKVLEEEEDDGRSLKDFTLEDMLMQMRRLKQMGSITDIIGMIPGANRMIPAGANIDDKQLARLEAIMSSMTEKERKKPALLNASRRKRIAAGSGTSVQDINLFMKNYQQMRKMMKQFAGGGMGALGAAPGGARRGSSKNKKKRRKRRKR